MKYPRHKNIEDQMRIPGEGFITWNDNDAESIQKAQAAVSRSYSSIQPIIRYGGNNSYNNFERRANESPSIFIPGTKDCISRRQIIHACIGAYKRVSPIRNIIDMMVDFTVQGIRLVHPNPQVQTFFQNWWKKIDGTNRSQHFVNNFYLMGTAIANRNLGKLSARVIDDIQRGVAAIKNGVEADEDDTPIYDYIPEPVTKQPKNVIPWSYNFLNPESVELLGGELALFAGKSVYGVEIPPNLLVKIKNPKNDLERDIVNSFPSYIVEAVKNGQQYIKLDDAKLIVSHYKKQDWQIWADPILYSIMDDIILLQKMKLADIAALDGAISHVRIWKLGSLEHKIMPPPEAIEKLSNILAEAGDAQSIDLIWGPDLTLEETKSDIYKYLGEAKYRPVLDSIYSGLGVPPTLVGGSSDGGGGFTSNFLSMKTLVERLNYGREALVRFWENEIKIVQQAMKFRFPAQIEFAQAVLTDDAAFHSMMIDLLDRDVISVERMRETLGYIPEIEEALVKYEWKARNNDKMPPKAGPFHDAEKKYGLTKIFATNGVVTPSQVGLDFPKAKSGEKTMLQMHSDLNPSTSPTSSPAKKGQQGEGRPRNSKDSVPRKTRKAKPRTSGSEDGAVGDSKFVQLVLWANEAQSNISSIVNPIYLKMCNKNNMRQLTTAEVEAVEHLKFILLCNTEYGEEINNETVGSKLQNPLLSYAEADNFWRVLVSTFMEKRQATPTVDDVRQIQNYVYAFFKGEYNG